MRVLGVDPGIVVTGYGIIQQKDDLPTRIISGEIKTGSKHPLPARLRKIYGGLLELIQEHSPDVVAIESTFLDKNFQSAHKLGQAQGVAMLAAEMGGLPVEAYTPAQVKMAVVGHGGAAKEQVQHMVGQILCMRGAWSSHHAADALSVALCHLQSARFLARVREASQR